jgi:hypothetical protein
VDLIYQQTTAARDVAAVGAFHPFDAGPRT